MTSPRTLVETLKHTRFLSDKRVERAFLKVDRSKFTPSEHASKAFLNEIIPLLLHQSISQPGVIAQMLQALKVRSKHKILEIGTGSGYQTALLAELVGPKGSVHSIELRPILAIDAEKNLKEYSNIHVITGDASKPEILDEIDVKKFDRVIINAQTKEVPEHLKNALKKKGVIVVPLGDVENQRLTTINAEGRKLSFLEVNFVPFVGAEK